MTKIDECEFNNVTIKFYDGIDVEYALEHTGDDMLIFFVDNWENVLTKHKRNNIIDGILYDTDIIDLDNIDNCRIAIYQTNGYLMETMVLIKNKMKRELIGTWNAIANKK